MALYCSPDYQTSFKSIDLSSQEKRFNIDFQDGDHGSYLVLSQLAFWFRRRGAK